MFCSSWNVASQRRCSSMATDNRWLLISLIWLFGCGDEPGLTQVQQPICVPGEKTPREECELAGGFMERTFSWESCTCPTADSGQPCARSTDCESACVAEAPE